MEPSKKYKTMIILSKNFTVIKLTIGIFLLFQLWENFVPYRKSIDHEILQVVNISSKKVL